MISVYSTNKRNLKTLKRWADTTDHTIGADVASYIFKQINGHPGVAGAMLQYVALVVL